MQVRIDGKPVQALTPRIERRLVSKRGPANAEGVVRDGDAVMASTRTSLNILMGLAGGLAVAVFGTVVVATALHEPRSLAFVALITALSAVFIGVVFFFVYRHRVRKMERRLVAILPQMAPPGTSVRADAQGLALDGRLEAWGSLEVQAVDIVRVSGGEGETSWFIDTLWLERPGGGRPIVLDAAVLSRGRQVVDFVWRTLRPRP
jgi:hypothetical protein